ncbi:MAG: 1-acyl-sn-glycerol-3-phosphate acyltransferase [Betaproteobacteria bacterium]|nr:1-acyl-sn-glycerol-3-phosphate acyltransferase [Betaproteobacteria bacterium]
MKKLLRILFVVLVAKPIIVFWLGLTIRHRERLPTRGPAIIAANHNSHLDTVALLSLFPLEDVPNVRPVAAADYFMKPGFMRWFSLNVIGIIPVSRGGVVEGVDPLAECYAALERGEILLIFPEGSRGEPEKMAELKSGISFIAKRFPTVPVIPVFMRGLGKSMGKGTFIPIPFFVDVFIGRPFSWTGEKTSFMDRLRDAFAHLQKRVPALPLE